MHQGKRAQRIYQGIEYRSADHFHYPDYLYCDDLFPFGYILMNRCLSNFQFHGKMSAAVFLFAGALSILVVALTVGWYVIKAANFNPVDAIRYE